MSDEDIHNLAEAIIQDDESREAAMRAVERAWDPRTGHNGLRSLFASFVPLAARCHTEAGRDT